VEGVQALGQGGHVQTGLHRRVRGADRGGQLRTQKMERDFNA
jgi:hypothetical protein